MKKIIAGQIMMWSNIVGITIGYLLFKMTGIESPYLAGVIGTIGVIGSGFNLFVSIALQVKGYAEDKIVNLID